jgi:hypothetical protein
MRGKITRSLSQFTDFLSSIGALDTIITEIVSIVVAIHISMQSKPLNRFQEFFGLSDNVDATEQRR